MRCLFCKHETKHEHGTRYFKSLSYGRCGCEFKCMMFRSAHIELYTGDIPVATLKCWYQFGKSSQQRNYQSLKIRYCYVYTVADLLWTYINKHLNWHTFYILNNANRFRNLNLNHQKPNENKKMYLSRCAYSCIVMSFIFVAIYTVSFEMGVNFSSWLWHRGGATKLT